MQLNAAGQVELKLKPPWRDGTTHLVMSPLEFMRRLEALVLRPRLHQPTTASRLSILVVRCPHWVEAVWKRADSDARSGQGSNCGVARRDEF